MLYYTPETGSAGYAFIARCPNCGHVCGTVIDDPAQKTATADVMHGWYKRELPFERVTIESVGNMRACLCWIPGVLEQRIKSLRGSTDLATDITGPALKYPGGKWNIAEWVISYFPDHLCYVEPFGGAASVLLKKQPSELEIYNDMDQEVVNFFRVLRERPDAFIRAVDLTPWSRYEHKLTYEPTSDPLEQARRFYVKCYQGRGRINDTPTGWRVQCREVGYSTVTQTWARKPDQLRAIVDRLKMVQFEDRTALEVISQYDAPTTLFYVDPPYVMSERSGSVYNHEMTDDQHRELASALMRARGKVVISGYHSALYDELYQGWSCVERNARTNGGDRTEVLWLSPRVQAELNTRKEAQPQQLSIFDAITQEG